MGNFSCLRNHGVPIVEVQFQTSFGTIKGSGVPYRPPADKSVSEAYPEVARQAYGWDPLMISFASNLSLPWRGDCGHIWKCMVTSRTRMKRGCPYCVNQKVWVGFNDFATTHPELAEQAHGWDPQSLVAGSSRRKVKWICELGHVWECAPATRTTDRGAGKNKDGCPYCSGHRVWPGFNDLATMRPDLALLADGWDPSTVTPYSHKKQSWKGSTCEHRWYIAVSENTNNDGRCMVCESKRGAPGGFMRGAVARVYLMRHSEWGLLKIGVTNQRARRIEKHQSCGWELVDMTNLINGFEAWNIESSVKQWLKDHQIPNGLGVRGEKFDGYTESWSEEDLGANSVDELAQLAGVL